MNSSLIAQNARLQSLGYPNLGGINLIEDISDVLTFPADIALSTNLAQGCVGAGYVYTAKEFLDLFSVGLLFGLPSYTTNNLGGNSSFHTALNNAYTAANNYPFHTGTPTGNPVPGEGNFDLTMPTAPTNTGHLLLGMELGSSICVGIDVFREASHSKTDEKDVYTAAGPTGPSTETRENKGFSKYGCLGTILGANLDLGTNIRIKAAFGIANLYHKAEMVHSGQNVSTTTVTYNTETSNMEAISGLYLPFLVKGAIDIGNHTLTSAINYTIDFYQFEAKFDDGDPGTTAEPPYKSDKYTNTYMGLGVCDEIKLTSQTHLIAALSIARISSKTTPENIDNDNREITNYTNIFPYTSLGIEHQIKNWWKFDEIILRAGGNKSVTWTSAKEEGGDALEKRSNVQTSSAFNWTTGLSLIKGKLELSMVITPASWNSLWFIGGAGPAGTNVTLTYYFGNHRQAHTSSGILPEPANKETEEPF